MSQKKAKQLRRTRHAQSKGEGRPSQQEVTEVLDEFQEAKRMLAIDILDAVSREGRL